jgi:hypothetical protein
VPLLRQEVHRDRQAYAGRVVLLVICQGIALLDGNTLNNLPAQQAHLSTVLALMGQEGSSQRHATYLRAVIANQERDCLLDTGSEISLLPVCVVEPSRINRTSHTLRAANGTAIPVLGEAKISLRVGRSSSMVTGLVSDHIAEVMLGVDWLTKNRVIWDFSSATIWMNGEYFKLLSAKKEHRSGSRHGNVDALSRRPCAKTRCVCHTDDVEYSSCSLKGTVPAFGGLADRADRPSAVIDNVPIAENMVDCGYQAQRQQDGTTLNRMTVVADVHPVPSNLPNVECGENCECLTIAVTTQSELRDPSPNHDSTETDSA